MLGQPSDRVIGRSAESLHLQQCLEGDVPRITDIAFPGQSGRWEIRRSQFRQEGHVHHLLVLSDLTRALREEERQAWQRVVQVLRHEINNSLAPIHSLAGSLADLLRRKGLILLAVLAVGMLSSITAVSGALRVPLLPVLKGDR